MIDYEESAKLNNMSIEELKFWFEKYPSSSRQIVVVCDNCGLERKGAFNGYRDLCFGCAHRTDEYIEKQSESHKRENLSEETGRHFYI